MRKKRPSNAVTAGALSGVSLGPVILWALSLAGVPLPVDPVQAAAVGMALSSVVGGVLGYFTRGGRHGEPQ